MKRMFRDDTGASAITVAIFVIMFVALSAVVVDAGYLYSVRRQLQAAADAAALSGCQELINGKDAGFIDSEARAYAVMNAVVPADGLVVESVEIGDDYVKVVVAQDTGLFFGRALGTAQTTVRAAAKAVAAEVAGARMLTPWAIPVIETVDHAEVFITDDAGDVLGSWNLSAESDARFTGAIAAPAAEGGYDVWVRIYNQYGIYETLRESQTSKEVPGSRLVVGDLEGIADVHLSHTFLTAESPDLPVEITARTAAPQTRVGVSVDGMKRDMEPADASGTLWVLAVGAQQIPESNDFFHAYPVDVYVGAKPDKAIDAYIGVRRSSHVIESFALDDTHVDPGTSVWVTLDLHDWAAHINDGTLYTLRVEGGSGEVGNFCELNFKDITHHHDCLPDPDGVDLGNTYYDWTRYGFGGGVHVGDIIGTSPGSSGINTKKALDARWSDVPADQHIVHVPIVEKYEDKGGTYDVIVVDFGAFLVTSYDRLGEVQGTFLEYVTIPSGFEPGEDPTPDYWSLSPRLVNP